MLPVVELNVWFGKVFILSKSPGFHRIFSRGIVQGCE